MTNVFRQGFRNDVCIRKVSAYYRAKWDDNNQIEQKKHIVPVIKHKRERESDTNDKIKKKKEIERVFEFSIFSI